MCNECMELTIDEMGFEELAVEQEINSDYLNGLRYQHGPNDGDPDWRYDEIRSGVGHQYFC
ncbi:hypothetical protein [Hungatella hathewayi]|uniref:hypothetical protein n=1 Tax=Hungatella hathewayi TaxID=154046 RepID=UPI003566F437